MTKVIKKEEVQTVEPVVETKGSVSVWFKDNFIRTYSSEVHGKNFRKLAEEFASKVKGRQVK